MVNFILGETGTGKTKKLIDLSNKAVQSTDGHIVFIDDDSRHIYDLHHDIRFVETKSFPLSNYREFIGFVCGILSQDSDITDIFVDGLTNIIKKVDNEDLLKLVKKLESLSSENSVNFTISLNGKNEDLPKEIKDISI